MVSAALVSAGLILAGCAGTAPEVTGEKQAGPKLPWKSSELKIGYIRSDVMTDEYPDYRDADLTLRSENRKWLDAADKMEKEIRRRETELDELSMILSEERRKQLEKELNDAQKELQKFQYDTWYDEDSQYLRRRRELMEPIDARVNDAIWKVAEAKNIDAVFDTVAGNIVYINPVLDITKDVLEELKK